MSFVKKVTPHYGFGRYYLKSLFWLLLGGFLAALAIQVFLIPNELVDGGVVGLAMMGSAILGNPYLPYLLVLFNLPFAVLGYKQIGKHFVVQMITAILAFALSTAAFYWLPIYLERPPFEFHGEALEIIVIGGFILGCGAGLIIRHGGSTDGTEIMGILINRRWGFTIGQVILFVNIFIFALAGLLFRNWHSAFMSLMTYVVATKVMDTIIVGFEDTKSAMIISSKPQELSEVIMRELNIGLTIMYGRGGYSNEEREILYIVIERLQLAELKEIVHKEDPEAFIAVENLHEVVSGRTHLMGAKKISPSPKKREPKSSS